MHDIGLLHLCDLMLRICRDIVYAPVCRINCSVLIGTLARPWVWAALVGQSCTFTGPARADNAAPTDTPPAPLTASFSGPCRRPPFPVHGRHSAIEDYVSSGSPKHFECAMDMHPSALLLS